MKILGYHFFIRVRTTPMHYILSEYHNSLSENLSTEQKLLMREAYDHGYRDAHKDLQLPSPKGRRS